MLSASQAPAKHPDTLCKVPVTAQGSLEVWLDWLGVVQNGANACPCNQTRVAGKFL